MGPPAALRHAAGLRTAALGPPVGLRTASVAALSGSGGLRKNPGLRPLPPLHPRHCRPHLHGGPAPPPGPLRRLHPSRNRLYRRPALRPDGTGPPLDRPRRRRGTRPPKRGRPHLLQHHPRPPGPGRLRGPLPPGRTGGPAVPLGRSGPGLLPRRGLGRYAPGIPAMPEQAGARRPRREKRRNSPGQPLRRPGLDRRGPHPGPGPPPLGRGGPPRRLPLHLRRALHPRLLRQGRPRPASTGQAWEAHHLQTPGIPDEALPVPLLPLRPGGLGNRTGGREPPQLLPDHLPLVRAQHPELPHSGGRPGGPPRLPDPPPPDGVAVPCRRLGVRAGSRSAVPDGPLSLPRGGTLRRLRRPAGGPAKSGGPRALSHVVSATAARRLPPPPESLGPFPQLRRVLACLPFSREQADFRTLLDMQAQYSRFGQQALERRSALCPLLRALQHESKEDPL